MIRTDKLTGIIAEAGLSQSDVAKAIGIHPKTFYAKMKKGAYFINTARGGVIVEQDLVDALKSGHLSGAAVDVLTAEPMRADCPLIDAPNITFTPHVAWAPVETRRRLLSIVMDNIENFLCGTPKNVVN